MTIEELLKALNLDSEEEKDRAEILTKEFNERLKEFNTLSKKNKELEESQSKLTESLENTKSITDKFDIVVKAYGLDLEAEDFDKMLDDVKDKIVKENGGATTPEEFNTVRRDLTKATRDLNKANAQIQELTAQLETEKNMRIDALKRETIKKALLENHVLKPDMMVDMFFTKVSVDKDGKTCTMKDAAGNEISIADGIADWAKENKEFVKAETKGGVGSSGGGSFDSDSNGVSSIVKAMIESRNNNSSNTTVQDAIKNFGI